MSSQSDSSHLPAGSGSSGAYVPERGGANLEHKKSGSGYGLRSIIAGLLVLVGFVITPLGITAKLIFDSVTDQDTYVSLMSGLARNPDVQKAIADEATQQALAAIDVDGLAGKDPSGTLGVLNSLVGTITGSDLREQVDNFVSPILSKAIEGAISSDKFQTVWSDANRQAHSALIVALNNDTEGVSGISSQGDVTLNAGELVSSAVSQDSKLGFVSTMLVNRDIEVPLIEKSQIDSVRGYYEAAKSLSKWAPIVGCIALAIGLVVAQRRWIIGLVIGATLLVTGLLPAILNAVLKVAEPEAFSGYSLSAVIGDNFISKAISYGSNELSFLIPVGIVVILTAIVLRVAFPKLRIISGN